MPRFPHRRRGGKSEKRLDARGGYVETGPKKAERGANWRKSRKKKKELRNAANRNLKPAPTGEQGGKKIL